MCERERQRERFTPMPVAELLFSTAHRSPAALVTGRTQVPQRDLSDMEQCYERVYSSSSSIWRHWDLLPAQLLDQDRDQAIIGGHLLHSGAVAPPAPIEADLQVTPVDDKSSKQDLQGGRGFKQVPDTGLRQRTASRLRCSSPFSVVLQ